jgi:hypothetical protein
MATATYRAFPDLSTIAFRHSDESDHEGGGHCAGLPDGPLHRQWELVLAQHMAAFDLLVEEATGGEDGWALTRPVLFAAHHVCEVGLKTAWVGHAGTKPAREHKLKVLWSNLEEAGGLGHLTPEQVDEAVAFLDLMAELTPDGQTARYPLPGDTDVSGTWCCLNSRALLEAVYAFLARIEP